ncbi:MAG: valine--tRNA ligase [Candidatus Diapherotrites archaeon]
MPENSFVSIEKKWQDYWEKEKIYAFDLTKSGPIYSVDTPPPTVSGRMHLGHAFSYTQADFIVRYKRMKGFNVFYPFGLDDNGLATERLVEKSRNIKAKDFSREEFIKICLEETKKYEDLMMSDFKSIGLSIDWSLTYRTIDSLARKTSQLSFIEIYKKKRAYRKEAPSMWCPTCETAIAQAELEDVEQESTFNDLKFPLEGGGEIIISTTRPELLSSCVAVFLHPSDERKKELLGRKAIVPLFDYAVPILEDKRVDPQKGTGIVMCCTFGDQTDMEWYFAHSLPLRVSFTKDGRMTELAKQYAGKKIREARAEIIKDLKEKGFLVSQKPIKHFVKVHERCKTEMEIMNTKQWFINYLDLKDEFIKKGNELNWFPKHMKVRYENWIKGLQWDWSLSRQRYFGVPFPVWYCKKCGEIIIAEESQLPVDPIQQKPLVSKCPKCGSQEFVPEYDVLDTWATSSLTPQINSKWAIESNFHKKIFPMSLRPQAHDIITLWAFNTIVKAYFHEGKLPWQDIMISGHALDPKGRKMSKSLGNVVNPIEMIQKYSADMLRYWSASGSLGEDLPFMEKEFIAAKKFIIKLTNVAKFVSEKSAGTKPDYVEKNYSKLKIIDKWIISKWEDTKDKATNAFEEYEFSKAMSALRNFFWLEFADFYIEEVKYRIYSEKENDSAISAKSTLLYVFSELLKAFSPFVPHTTEEIWQNNFKNLQTKKSIHLEQWPEPKTSFINQESLKAGDLAKEIIALIRKQKSESKMAMNAPLKEFRLNKKIDNKLFSLVEEDIKGTMNVGKIIIS